MIKMYNFSDFLPLTERKAGHIYMNGKLSAVWVVNPTWGGSDQAQIMFRQPANPTVWKSDIWRARPSGPQGLPYWYLNSHVNRQENGEDYEFPIEQDKSILHRKVLGIWYKKDVSEPGILGIPYFRQNWRVWGNGSMTNMVQNWYWIRNHKGVRKRRVFHQQEFIHQAGDLVEGPEWHGPAPAQRGSIKLSEAYWEMRANGDSHWLIGSGDEDPSGEPTGENVVYGRTRHHAYKTIDESGVMAFGSEFNGALSGTRITWPY